MSRGWTDTAALLAFVDQYIVSFDAWDVLAFFGAHPGSSFSADELARQIGRSRQEVVATARVLESLHALLGADGEWCLEQDEAFVRGLESFMHAIGSSKGRLLVLTRVLGNVQG